LSQEEKDYGQSGGYKKVIAGKGSKGSNKEGAQKANREERKMMAIMRQIRQMERKENTVNGRLCPNEVEGEVVPTSDDHDSPESIERQQFIADSVAHLRGTDQARQEDGSEDQDGLVEAGAGWGKRAHGGSHRSGGGVGRRQRARTSLRRGTDGGWKLR